MDKKNALKIALELIKEEKYTEARKVCKDYLEKTDDDSSWETLTLEEEEELALQKINCVIRSFYLVDFRLIRDEDGHPILNDDGIVEVCEKHEILTKILYLDIYNLSNYLKIKDYNSLESKYKHFCERICSMANESYSFFRNYYMPRIEVEMSDSDTAMKDWLKVEQGISDLYILLICICSDLREMINVNADDDYAFSDLLFNEKIITNDSYFEKAKEIFNLIASSTNDYPYFFEDVATHVIRMFEKCLFLIDLSLPDKDDEKNSEKQKRIIRLKEYINVSCDYLNSLVVVNGQRLSILAIESQRYDYYHKILEYEKEIQQSDMSYKHPSVTVQKRSTANNNNSGCYVATCVYGSYDCPEVWTLRRYRDNILAESWYGRTFIKIYYAISPTIVKWFGNTNWFKRIWRGRLDNMVAKLQSNGIKSTPYKDKTQQ